MDFFSTVVDIGLKYVWGFPEQAPWLVLLLLSAGFYVTARTAFVQLRQLRHAVGVVSGKYDDPADPGDVSHFQALSTALSATVGIGNIAGVATAIHYGGPGAVFWMWVTAVFGMALKFAECTLSVHFRQFDARGEAAGGPMYYIERGLGRSWKPLAIAFAFLAILSSFGSGNMNQANSVAVSAITDLGLSAAIVGLVLAFLVAAVILGGIRSIARVASRLAPTMAVIYVAAALVILAIHAREIPAALTVIVRDAFSPRAGVGGSVAGVFSVTLLWGVKRGLFSNEAGQGSAPIAHAAAKTNEPVREGVVAMLGPFIDTLIICTMTALVIIITGVWDQKRESEIPLAAAQVAAVALSEHDLVPPQHPGVAARIPVAEGRPLRLLFSFNDGLVENPRILAVKGGAASPFRGTLELWGESEALRSRVRGEDDAGLPAAAAAAAELAPTPGRTWVASRGQLVPSADAAGERPTLVLRGAMLENSSALTSWAFQKGLSPLGPWGNYVVTLSVFLFALSTMISWSYYGDRCVTYLFAVKYVPIYRLMYVGFVYLGATTKLETVWAYGDLALGLMTVPNLVAVVLLMPTLVALSRDYFARMKKRGSLSRS